jgi:adiponectin receptor
MTSVKKVTSRNEIPELLHLKYIEDGYRANHTLSDAFFSLFNFHNESMNVWTHFIGFICITIAGVDFMMDYLELQHLSNAEFVAFEIYIICTASCLLFSTIYHLFRCVSEKVHLTLLRLDITGVGFQAAGSFVPLAYFGKKELIPRCPKTLKHCLRRFSLCSRSEEVSSRNHALCVYSWSDQSMD